jgi:hypothetical protein
MEFAAMDTPQPNTQPQYQGFDVVSAFSQLETARKMVLFDQLMCGRANAYRNTLKAFWPDSDEADARKLEVILRARLDRLKKLS